MDRILAEMIGKWRIKSVDRILAEVFGKKRIKSEWTVFWLRCSEISVSNQSGPYFG